MAELAALGSDSTKRIWLKHGAREPFYGVKIADLKPIAKKLKGRHELAMELYATGNGDAQYLAGMVADGAKMSTAQLQSWAKGANWRMISSTILPWVASENPAGFKLACDWIDAKNEGVAVAGWHVLGAWVSTRPDDQLSLKELEALLERVVRTLPSAPDRVRQAMNYFIIACGSYVAPLGRAAIAAARSIGKVEVDVGDTDCRIPDAESYIMKTRRGAPVAPKRKTLRC